MSEFTGEILFDGITNIDDDLIVDADSYRRPARTINLNLVRWGALAASLLIVAAGAIALFRQGLPFQSDTVAEGSVYQAAVEEAPAEAVEDASPQETMSEEKWAAEPAEEPAEEPEPVEEAAEDVPHITLNNGLVYYPGSDEQIFKKYKLDNADIKITEDDLGKEIGTVKEADDEALIGLKVYRYKPLEDDDTICVVDDHGDYIFYTV